MNDLEYTKGPWAWFGTGNNQNIYLATTHSGRHYVMCFERWGMRGVQPSFQPKGRGLVPAKDLLKFEVGDRSITGIDGAKKDDSVYRYDIRGIDCADARLIAAAPELYEALKACVAAELNTGNPYLSIAQYDKKCEAALQKALAVLSKIDQPALLGSAA